jgi:Zn-finger nucleic acid-binding protein
MNCPVDGATLQMTDRQGIEIDYCPKCRGVWLDRGELDKLIERSVPPVRPVSAERHPEYDDDDDDRYEREHGDHPRKKRKSLLGELFDF